MDRLLPSFSSYGTVRGHVELDRLLLPFGPASISAGVDLQGLRPADVGALSIVEYPMEPGRLVLAHIHHNEDELSPTSSRAHSASVIGEEIAMAGSGSYIYKPRGIPHTFWNPGPEPARLIEII